MPGNGSAPILTMDLTRQGSVPKIQVKIFDSGTVVGSADLAPLQAVVLIVTVVTVLINIAVEVSYFWFDPRIQVVHA